MLVAFSIPPVNLLNPLFIAPVRLSLMDATSNVWACTWTAAASARTSVRTVFDGCAAVKVPSKCFDAGSAVAIGRTSERFAKVLSHLNLVKLRHERLRACVLAGRHHRPLDGSHCRNAD